MFVRFLLVAFISLITVIAFAQKKGADYFIITVKSGETFKSIATRYNFGAREIADYNNLEYYSGELTAKTLRIPRKKVVKKEENTVPVRKDTVIGSEVPLSTTGTADTSQYQSTNPQYSAPEDNSADTTVQTQPAETVVETSVVRQNLPVLLYIVVSIILLIVAVVYYRFVNRN